MTAERTPAKPEASQKRAGAVVLSIQTLATIRRRLDGTDAAFGIAVLVALETLSRFAGTRSFEAPIAQVAGHAGLRYRKTAQVLALLEQAKVVRVERFPKHAKRPHVYHLRNRKPDSHSMPIDRHEGIIPACRQNPLQGESKDSPIGEGIGETGSVSPAGGSAFAGWGLTPPRGGRRQDGHHKTNAT